MKLRRLRTHNFRSIIDAAIEVHDYTMIVGANNAGTRARGSGWQFTPLLHRGKAINLAAKGEECNDSGQLGEGLRTTG